MHGLKKFTQEIRLSSPSSDRLEWQVGGYYTHENGALHQHLDGVTLPAAGPATPCLACWRSVVLDSTYKEWAGFANLTYHFNSQFDIQAGGRYSSNEQSATESITGPDWAGAAGLHHAFQGQCIYLFGCAALARRCEHHGVCARRHGLSSGRSQCVAAHRAAGRAARVRRRQNHQPRTRRSIDPARRTAVDRRRGLPRRLERHSAVRESSTTSASTATAARRKARASNGRSAMFPCMA